MDTLQPTRTSHEEGAFLVEEAAALAKGDPDFLSGLATPDMWEYAWPPTFISIWFWLVQKIHLKRSFDRLAIGLPRGFGKTTLIKLFILYVILFTDRKFILILSETAAKAEAIIADVIDMLNEPNIKALFGDWSTFLEKDTLGMKKFSFRGRPIIIAGLGQGGSVRGLNIKNARPDVMVFEDVQSREDADSGPVSDGIYRWMTGTAMKAKSPKGCLYVFIANMYPTPHSILKKLKHDPYWDSYIAGGILTDPNTGEMSSLWEELQPLAQLIQEFQADMSAGKPEIFYSEVLNDENASVNNRIDLSKIPPYSYDDHDIHAGNYVVIDPATDRDKADYVTVMYYEVHNGRPVCIDLEEDNMSPGATIRSALKFCMRYGCRLVVIEGNAYQSTLCYWFGFICRQMGIEGINAVPIFSGKAAKNSRIMKMFTQLLPSKEDPEPELLLHPRTRALVYNQITSFNPLKTNNTDGILDCLTYGPRVLTEFADYLISGTIIEQQMTESEAIDYLDEDAILAMSPF